jgi:MFS family permease
MAPASRLGPFRIRNFRFQWPADLATSWAFEMETLILGWYVLVETGSVLALTLFASLQYIGTLTAPMFGVVGDRIGHREMLCGMRALYATLAGTLMSLAFAGVLAPVHVFVIAALMGIVRPSDQVMRYSLIGAIIPPDRLTVAIGIARTTADSARIVGALAGAGLVATLGIGPAYAVVTTLYATSFVLTLQIRTAARKPRLDASGAALAIGSPWRDLRAGIAYVWTRDHLLAAMCLAFLVNMTAFPLVMGLMPYVAREIYHTDQTGLGYLVASFASGALCGSLAMARIGGKTRPARTMLVFCALWYVAILVFARMPTHASGCLALAATGLVQSMGMISMSTMILRNAEAELRGRVMGIRMLAIYGLPIGLVVAGQLIPRIGYPATATLYCAVGLAGTALIAMHWRSHVWRLQAAANAR